MVTAYKKLDKSLGETLESPKDFIEFFEGVNDFSIISKDWQTFKLSNEGVSFKACPLGHLGCENYDDVLENQSALNLIELFYQYDLKVRDVEDFIRKVYDNNIEYKAMLFTSIIDNEGIYAGLLKGLTPKQRLMNVLKSF